MAAAVYPTAADSTTSSVSDVTVARPARGVPCCRHSMTKQRTLLTVLFAGVGLLVSAASAGASPGQLALIQDDAAFVEGRRGDPRALLYEARHELGADIVRANLYWRAVSPAPGANSKPRGFRVGDPSSPRYRWAMYDQFVANARAAGLRVYLTITGPTPDWGSREPRRCREGCIWKPNSRLFGKFVKAVARRYRGQVRYWSIWNEPNHFGWLLPQYSHRHRVRYSARMYRSLWYRGYRAIRRYDPARRRSVLFGELAPFASPRAFLHSSMCIDRRGRPLRSRRQRCPRRPVKLPVGAIAHHPYPHGASVHPLSPVRGRSNLTIAYMPRLKRSMLLAARHGRMPRGRSIFLTEYGIQSRPPDPFGASPRQQARWLNESERLVWRDRRVKSTAQYELFDAHASEQFNTGLRTAQGARKPAWAAYRISVTVTRRGRRRVEIWGWVKPGRGRQVVEVRARRRGRNPYRVVRRVRTNPRGMFRIVRRGRSATRLVYKLRHRTDAGDWHSRSAVARRPLRYRG